MKGHTERVDSTAYIGTSLHLLCGISTGYQRGTRWSLELRSDSSYGRLLAHFTLLCSVRDEEGAMNGSEISEDRR